MLEFYVVGTDFAECFVDIGRIEIENVAFDVIMKTFCAVYFDVLDTSISTENAFEFSKEALTQAESMIGVSTISEDIGVLA